MIRPALPADAAGIAAIWNAAIRETTVTFNPVEKTLDEIAGLTQGSHAFFVWESAGQILGFARYFQFRAGAGNVRSAEHTILLHPDGRGQGGGRALMMAITDHATAAGMSCLIAGVSAENDAGLAFHAAMGFAKVGHVQSVGWKFERFIDLVLMQKMLSPAAAARLD